MSRPRLTAADNAEILADTQALAASEAVPAEATPDATPPAGDTTPANDAAAPANDADADSAPDATPDATPPPAEQPGRSTAERLAAIKKAQQRAVAERRAIAEERAQVQAMREQVEREVASLRETIQREAQAIRAKALEDVTPLAEARKLLASDSADDRLRGLQALGFSYEDTTQMMLGGGGLTPQQIEAKLRKEYDERLSAQESKILKAIEEREAKAREADEARVAAARREQSRQAAVAHAATLVRPDAHPLAQGLIDEGEYTREEIGEAVVRIIETDWEQRANAARNQGFSDEQIRTRVRALDYVDAYGMLESSLESDLARLERARQRKLAGKGAPTESKLDDEGKPSDAASQSKANQNPGHPTLTGSESSQVASKRGAKSMRELRQQVYQETPVLLGSGSRR